METLISCPQCRFSFTADLDDLLADEDREVDIMSEDPATVECFACFHVFSLWATPRALDDDRATPEDELIE